ncbi:MAG: superoxide dismutase family protein [Oscillospiraceae bacterium]|nr:superoxide dismutase family protein [Oscillospiraceae bacterium]
MKQDKAGAQIRGEQGIRGTVRFRQCPLGVVVTADISGLPESEKGFFAFHIHEDGHYNTEGKNHPQHAGDLPPLLSCNGKACMSVLSDRFSLDEIIGKTVVIHEWVDDFTSQPSGNPGKMIAGGVICNYYG